MTVTEGRISLRTNAYVELHAWLADAARSDAEVPAELEPARAAYRRSLADDDEDAELSGTTAELSRCTDDRCATAATARFGFGRAYARALPIFTARWWRSRASTAFVAVEAAHAALAADGMEAILERAATELGVAWPDAPVTVDVVSQTPALGRSALVPVALGARGRCFPKTSSVLDCVLVRVMLTGRQPSPLRVALVRELGVHDGERAWELVVVHGVAATVTSWAPRHASSYLRAAHVVEPRMLDWLAREWRGSREPPDAFAVRFAAEWRASR
jgi:hypothetical protein